jgi:hypothetical protein
MRFSLKRRIFSVVSASWLVLLLAEPPALHVCAVHGSAMQHATTPHSAHEKSPAHEHSSQCSCLGTSSYSNPVVISSVEETEFAEAPIVFVASVPTDVSVAPASSSPFFLPYPNGPPAAIAA